MTNTKKRLNAYKVLTSLKNEIADIETPNRQGLVDDILAFSEMISDKYGTKQKTMCCDVLIDSFKLEKFPEEIRETQIIEQFFRELPKERLKKLIKFRKIDPQNKEQWDACQVGSPEWTELCMLRNRRESLYKAELYLP